MAQVFGNLGMIVVAAQGRDLIRLGNDAGGALGVLAAQLDALPVADVLDPPIECEGFAVNGEQIVAPVAFREAHVQVVITWLSDATRLFLGQRQRWRCLYLDFRHLQLCKRQNLEWEDVYID